MLIRDEEVCTMEKTEETARLEDLLRLRLAVAALGETNRWWPSKICQPTRFPVLRQLFPGTWRLAAFSAVSESAKIVQRDALAHRALHLFRFQTEIEQDLRRYLGDEAGMKLFDEVLASGKDPESVLGALAQKGVHGREGAVEMGVATEAVIYGSVGKMAALYLAAFRNGTRCYPYFLPQKESL